MPPHILVIDDQISLPRFIAMELHAEGYQVSLFSDAIADLSIVRTLKPDLIVLNWELRRTSGFNICHQLKMAGNDTPIVVITAEDENSCHLALELGAQTCLTKPFSMNDLLKAIGYHLKPAKSLLEYSNCY